MYGLMFVLPLAGWGMLSAARYPIVLYGSLHLPFILPHDAMLYAVLRKGYTILACSFFLMFCAHFVGILFHTLTVRDGIIKRIAPWNIRPQEAGGIHGSKLTLKHAGHHLAPVSADEFDRFVDSRKMEKPYVAVTGTATEALTTASSGRTFPWREGLYPMCQPCKVRPRQRWSPPGRSQTRSPPPWGAALAIGRQS
jgi:hypothetical protein